MQNAGDYTRLIGPVYIGNEAAAVSNSTTNTFTHLLCVSEELEQPQDLTEDSGVTFVKVPFEFGVTFPLDEELLHDAVRTVRKVWKKHLRAPDSTTPSILIYCRYTCSQAYSQTGRGCAGVTPGRARIPSKFAQFVCA